MKRCSKCFGKISIKNRLKSLFTWYGDIECNNCKSVFRLNKTTSRNIATFIIPIIGCFIGSYIDGIKGLLLGTALILLYFILEINFNNNYSLVNK